MKINGEQIFLKKEISLEEFLQQQGYDIQRVAVEKNGVIVPKTDFAKTLLTEEDILEVVCFVGGG